MKTQFTTRKTLIAAAVLAANFNLQAQQADELETITVTATRTEQAIDQSLSSTVVIDRAEIEALQPFSTIDLLSRVAGLDVSQQGSRGQASSVFMRGTNSNHTLVLVDGIRISSATLGTADLQSIAPSQIDRIEIVKGPRAAVWGSDAIGGVIQIFTRKSEGFAADLSFGSESYKQATATLGFSHGDGRSSITVSREQADGFDVFGGAVEGQEDKDGFEQTSFTAVGEQNVSSQLKLSYLLQSNKSENEYDSNFAGNDQVETDNYTWNLAAAYQWSNSDELSVKIGQSQDSRRNYKEGSSFDSLFETNRDQLSITNSSNLDESTNIAYGLDYTGESITTTGTYNSDERYLIGLFGYGQKTVGQFTLEAALRYDDVEDIDSEVTYNLGAGYDLTENTSVALTHSTGFKAPSFNDLYSPYGGHTDISSETSETTEILVKHQFEAGRLGLSVYQTEVDDLIVWNPIAPGSFDYRPDNVAKANIEGAEFEVNFVYGGFTHDVNFALINTEDGSTGDRLIRRAREHFNYSLAAQMGELDFSLSYSYKGDRTDRFGVVLDGYSLVNSKLGYAISDAVSLNFKVNNLFDEEYSTASGYNTQGQTFYFGVSYQQ